MALPSPISMLSAVATLSARDPAQRVIAVAISSTGTQPTTSALQRNCLLSGVKRTDLAQQFHRPSSFEFCDLTPGRKPNCYRAVGLTSGAGRRGGQRRAARAP